MEHALTEIAEYLLNQSWQIAAIFVLAAVACWTLRKASAHWRYLLWLVVLAKCLTPPLVTLPLPVLPPDPPQNIELAQAPPADPVLPEMDTLPLPDELGEAHVYETLEASSYATPEPADMYRLPVAPATPTAEATPAAPAAVVAVAKPAAPIKTQPSLTATQWGAFGWIAAAGVFGVFALFKAYRVQRRLKRTRRPITGELRDEVAELARRLGLRGEPKVWLIDGIGQPFVWGLLRGSIYLPGDFAGTTSTEYRRGILMHELAHISRWDAAVNAIQILAQGVFLFHPLIWWANRRIRAEREKCCDEMAIAALSARPKQYSAAIIDVLVNEYESARPISSLAIAGPVKNIEERIKTIMKPDKRFYKRPTWLAIITVLLLAALAVPTALTLTARAEKPAKPDKETATAPATQPGDADKAAEADVRRVAGQFLAAVRDKNIKKMKALSLGSVTGWLDRKSTENLRGECLTGIYLPLLEKQMKEIHKEVYAGRLELITQIQELAVQDEWAAVRIPFPEVKARGGRYMVVVFRKTLQGWRFVYWDAASGPLKKKFAKYSQTLAKGLAAAGKQPATQPVDEALVEKLVALLGDSKWKVREEATAKLTSMGTGVVPLLRKYRDSKDPEIASRVAMVLGNFDGVVILEVIADSQAERLGLRLGDVVIKVDQVKITPANYFTSLSGKNARTLLILRDGKTLTVNVGQDEIGIRFAYCKMAKGGEKWASGLAALGKKRYRRAYSLLSAARTEGVYNGLTTSYLACLAEYHLDHKRAMEIAGTIHGRHIANHYPPPADRKLKNRVLQYLPLRSLQTAFLLRQLEGVGFSPAWAAGYAHFMRAGRNFPLARQASNHIWPEENKNLMQYFYNRTRMFVALHNCRYADTIKERKSLPQNRSWMDCLVVVAAVNDGNVKTAGDTANMILSQDDEFFNEVEMAYTLYAIAAAAAAGNDDLLDTLLDKLKNLPPEKLDGVLKNDAAYCLHHLAVTPKLLPVLLKAAGDGKYENINYELLRQLSIKPGLTIKEWNGAFKRYGSTTKATRNKFSLLNTNALLRMRQVLGTKHKGQTVFITTGDVQMCKGAKKGSLWGVRYDGKCFYIESMSNGAVREFPGMSPGQIHDPLAGDRLVVLKTGTICVRRTQVYLFDEQAKRWLPTFAAPPQVQAATKFFADATAPAALKCVLKNYPIDGAGRECLGVTETGQWRCYYFNGDVAIVVNKKTYQAIDLGKHIGNLAGLKKRAAVYNPGVFGDKDDKTLLCPTEAGAWILSNDGKISRIKLPIKDQNVITIRMPYPGQRDGKLHIGVAPQQGGEVFEYDTKTGKVSKTGGYCGLGPDDSFFVISRLAHRVRCEYAIQTLYERRLAGKNNGN